MGREAGVLQRRRSPSARSSEMKGVGFEVKSGSALTGVAIDRPARQCSRHGSTP